MSKKCLVVIPRMPFPLNSGGRIAIYDAIKILSQKYELVLIIIDDDKSNAQYISNLSGFSKEIYFFSKSKYRCYLNAIKGLFFGKPLQVGYFYFKDVQELVNKKAAECDFLFAFMIRTTMYGMGLSIKKVHYAIDSMYLNYKKSKEKTTSLFWKMIYKIELPLLYRAEVKQIQKYNLTTFVNKEEASFWKEKGQVATLPHGVVSDVLNYEKTDKKYSNVVGFIGRMDYQPNIEAVLWFCKNVVPNLNKGIEFWIIGGHPTQDILNMVERFENVKVLGFVDDPFLILRSGICTVAPMQSGGGLQTKILMAMAVESLVITSSLPVAAIEDAEDGVNLIIKDDPVEFANVINDIHSSPSAYSDLKVAGKRLVLDNYSIPIIESKLFNLIDNHIFFT